MSRTRLRSLLLVAPTLKLSELFAKALEAAVSGTYQTGGQSGAWTVQAFK